MKCSISCLSLQDLLKQSSLEICKSLLQEIHDKCGRHRVLIFLCDNRLIIQNCRTLVLSGRVDHKVGYKMATFFDIALCRLVEGE
jgi:hypothetical protein